MKYSSNNRVIDRSSVIADFFKENAMVRMMSFLTVLAFLGGLVTAQEADKSDAVQDVPNGKINWTKQYVYATGSGAPDLKAPNVAVARLGAERVAKADAYRNLLEAIKGVTVVGTTTMKDSMEESMEVKTSVEGLVKGAEIVTTKYYSDGGVDVVIRVPLSSLYDKAAATGAADKELASKESVKAGAPAADAKKTLVIDARGLKFAPTMFPAVYTDDGKIVYSKKQVKDEALKAGGVARYVKNDLDAVTALYGDAATLLVVKASKLKNKSDLVVGAAEVTAIQTKLAPDALSEGRVVILY